MISIRTMVGKKPGAPTLLLAMAALLAAATMLVHADGSPAVERGRKIYREGAEGMVAVVSGTPVASSVLPCGSCHGADGRGRPEGGVKPSNLTWEDLTRDRSGSADGRRHPGYTEKQLRRAITMGLDPAGNALQAAMPRYRMSNQQMDDLIAYLKVLGGERDMGLSDSTIETGTLFGYRSGGDDVGAAMLETIRACFDEVNGRGGIYGRRIVLAAPSAADSTPERLRQFIARSAPFAMVGSIGAGVNDDPSTIAAERRTPLVGAVAAEPRRDAAEAGIFYLFPGLAGECGALVAHAIRHLDVDHARGVVLHDGAPLDSTLARALTDTAGGLGWKALVPFRVPDDPAGRDALLKELSRQDSLVLVMLLPPAVQADLLRRLPAGWRPRLLVPSSLWVLDPGTIPAALDGRIYISYPLWRATTAGAAEYDALRRKYRLGENWRSYRLAALASAKIYIEALMRSGRDLSRETLLARLRAMYRFDTGVIPPVTFGPNRSIGSTEVFIARVDLSRKKLDLVGD